MWQKKEKHFILPKPENNNKKGVSKCDLIPAMSNLREQFVLLPVDTAIGYYFVAAELL